MKKSKRIVAVLLIVGMVLSMLPLQAFASENRGPVEGGLVLGQVSEGSGTSGKSQKVSETINDPDPPVEPEPEPNPEPEPKPEPPTTYTVSYDYQGATGGNSKKEDTVEDGKSVGSLPKPTKKGSVFGGWFYGPNGDGGKFEGTTRVDSNIIVYAYWITEETSLVTVTFDYQGGTESDKTKIVNKNSKIGTLPSTSRSGYTFGGWYTAKNGGGTSYSSSSTVAEDITLYAKWTEVTTTEKWTVTFNYQNATGNKSETSRSVTKGAEIGSLPSPSRTNYTFSGWYTQSGGKGTRYSSSTKVNSNITLYAYWTTGNQYTVTFDYQNATDGTKEKSRPVASGEKVDTLPKPTRKNYTFGGWFTKKNGEGTQYSSSTKVTSNVTLYAYWRSGDQYTLTFDYQKATSGDSTDSKLVDKNGKAGTLPTPKKDGYQFGGWFTKKDGAGTEYDSGTKVTGNVTLYAYWMLKNGYTIKFSYQDADGGDNRSEQVVEKNGKAGTLPVPTRSDHTFKGWFTKKDGEGTEYTNSTKVTDDVTLYAYWEVKNGYTVTFDYQGATSGNSEKSRIVTKDKTLGTLPRPGLQNNVFKGWFTDRNGRGDEYTANTKITKNVTLYAHFEKTGTTQPNPGTGQNPGQGKGRFKDVNQNDWFYAPVEFVVNKNLFSGTGDDSFSPGSEMTRAMFVTVMGRMAESMGIDVTGYSHSFSDVERGAYYEKYVAWAAANNIVEGYNSYTFGTNDRITREQMASLFVRFADYASIQFEQGSNMSFNDGWEISDWAKNDVDKVVAAGLMQGSNGKFNPKGSASRAEVATVFMNMSNKYVR